MKRGDMIFSTLEETVCLYKHLLLCIYLFKTIFISEDTYHPQVQHLNPTGLDGPQWQQKNQD